MSPNSHDAQAAEQYTILAVCTGNICRSPAMERLLAHLLRGEDGITVISAGTYAHDGEDMQKQMKDRIADYGAEVEDFVAEQVTPTMIIESDLVLAATRVHVNDMLAEVPEAEPKIFTLREFGRILEELEPKSLPQGDTSEKLKALTELVSERRTDSAEAGEEDDVVDPYMLPDDVFDESFRQIREPIEALGRVLGLRS
ncbi:arsenate reductase/protein-tyrosine-phosphatase family protein [Nesterenkonia flava]|uniref:Low molecular weight phosphatase family protein n=1 Tax=Nesterenkonia flava TaxID=469799 RepID=A0ABU1FT97_9MICC|nr:low molecular weight phosphatase family protein [Nesterenkonia flava]MDR5711869.1 low molecular weight phosphatase family protein [Nesterenkonia flava]